MYAHRNHGAGGHGLDILDNDALLQRNHGIEKPHRCTQLWHEFGCVSGKREHEKLYLKSQGTM